MRKTFKVLLLAVMLLIMVGMTMVIASAEGGQFEVTKESTSQGTFATFDEALAKLKETGADTIKLTGDVTLDSGIVIDTPLTLDGQTYIMTFPETFKGTSEGYVTAITVTAAGNVAINNIVIDVVNSVVDDAMQNDYKYAIVLDTTGTLAFNDAEVRGGTYMFRHEGTGTISVDGANSLFTGQSSNFWSAAAAGTLELKAGHLNSSSGSDPLGAVGVNGCTFKMSGGTYTAGGDAFYLGKEIHVDVTGGTINCKKQFLNPAAGSANSTFSFKDCQIIVATTLGNVRGANTTVRFENTTVTSTGNTTFTFASAGSLVIINSTFNDIYQFALSKATSAQFVSGTFNFAGDGYGVDIAAGDAMDEDYTVVFGKDVKWNATYYSIVVRANRKVKVEGGSYDGCNYIVGELLVEGGTFTADTATKKEIFNLKDGGKITLKTATVNAPAALTTSPFYVQGSNAQLNIEGGTYTNFSAGGYNSTAHGTGGKTVINISGGNFTSAANSFYMFNINNPGSTLNITGGTLEHKGTSHMVRIADGGAVVNITGGTLKFHHVSSSDVGVFGKYSGELNIDWTRDKDGEIVMDGDKKVGPTFEAAGTKVYIFVNFAGYQLRTTISGGYFNLPAKCEDDGSTSTSKAIYTYNSAASSATDLGLVINDGVFVGESNGDLVTLNMNANAANATINGGTFIKRGTAGWLFNTTVGGTLTVNGGHFIIDFGGYGFVVQGKGTCNLNDGFFSYVEYDKIDWNGNMNGLKNNGGVENASAIVYCNSAEGIVNFNGGLYYGGSWGKSIMLLRGSINIKGGTYYGFRIFDMDANGGALHITLEGDAAFHKIPGQNRNMVFSSYTANTSNGVMTDTRKANYANSTFTVLGGNYTNESGTENFLQLYAPFQSVTFGKEGMKNEDLTINSVSTANLVWFPETAGTTPVTIYGGIYTNSGAGIFAVNAGVFTIHEGVYRSAGNAFTFNGTASATIYNCFTTFNDGITGPDQIDPAATALPAGSNGLTAGGAIGVSTTGTVTIHNATVQQGDSNGALVITSGTVVVHDGTYYGYRAIYMSGGNVTVKNGNFYGAVGQQNTILVDVIGAGNLTIEGGNFDVTHCATTGVRRDGHNALIYVGAAGATVTILDGTFKAAQSAAVPEEDMGAFLFGVVDDAALNISGGEFTMLDGVSVGDMTNVTLTRDEAPATFVLAAGGFLPDDDEKFANVNWRITSWSGITIDDANEDGNGYILTDLGEFYNEMFVAALAESHSYLTQNCTVDVTEWIPLTVADGGLLIINMAEKVVVDETLVTIQGGKVIVMGGEYETVNGAYDASKWTFVGMFEMSGGELEIQGGTFNCVGVFVHFAATASATVSNVNVTMSTANQAHATAGAFWFDGEENNSTLEVSDSAFSGMRFVTIYAVNEQGGVEVSVSNSTFVSTADAEDAEADNGTAKYHFQIARNGAHVISLDKITVTGTDHAGLLMRNAGGEGGAFTLTNSEITGGRFWIYANRTGCVINVSNTSFTDNTGTMIGDSSALIILAAASMTLSFEDVQFDVKSDLFLFTITSAVDAVSALNLTKVQAKAVKFSATSASEVELNVNDVVLKLTGAEDVVFDYANTNITKAVVVSSAEYIMTDVAFGAVQVKYAEDVRYAYVKVPATEDLYAELAGGAAIDVSSGYIATHPEKGGIRFISYIDDATAADLLDRYYGATFTFGTLIAPADYVAAAGEFTMEALDKLGLEIAYVNIEATPEAEGGTLIDADGNGIPESFSGALVALNSYTRAYAGISYIKVELAGDTTYLYGAFDTTANARSAQQVAQAMKADLTSPYYIEYSDAQKAVVDAYEAGIKISE